MKPTINIPVDELKTMRQSSTVSECAKHYGVSNSTIEKRLNEKTTANHKEPVRKFGSLGNPNSVDPNTALYFVESENQRLQRELENYKTQRNDARSKIESLKDEKIRLERDLEKAQNTIDTKPTGLAGFAEKNPDLLVSLASAIGPVAIEKLAGMFGGNKTQAALPQMASLPDGIPNEILQSINAVSTLLGMEYTTNPQRFNMLFQAYINLTQPQNANFLQQLSTPNA